MLLTIFIVYLKTNPFTGKIYIGRTHGKVASLQVDILDKVVRRRDSSHQKNKEGFEPAEMLEFSQNADAIRGLEQKMIEHYQKKDKSANKINGISPKNKKKAIYLAAALETFGEIWCLLFYLSI